MKLLDSLIERCHERHQNPLRQRKTKVTPALYKGLPYHFTVQCAYKYPIKLYELEQAGISFMPIGCAPHHDHGPRTFAGQRFLKRQSIVDWEPSLWHRSWGIQVYTGIPSENDGAKWHDIDIKYEAICAAPDAVYTCIQSLINAVANPLLTLTKSGGIRFSCRVPRYLHQKNKDAKQYIYRYTPTSENPDHREVYLEIFGEEGYSQWDARYEILVGNLLNPPIIAKEVLFAAIDTLRTALHKPEPQGEERPKDTTKVEPVSPAISSSYNINLAVQAFLRRGFVYLREEDNVHYWKLYTDKNDSIYGQLWEDKGIVYVRASEPNAVLPMQNTPITHIWDDTGILPLLPTTGLPVTDKVLAIREGNLSPLAIRRPSTMLYKSEHGNRVYNTLEETATQMQNVLNQDVRILGLIAETGAGKSYAAGSYVLNGGAINLTTKSIAKETEQAFQRRNIESFARWRHRSYLFEQVRDIPVAERMTNPFQRGNVCEDPIRCNTLERKGGNPTESICPKCPVYTECQQRGYLSQKDTLKSVKGQISSPIRLLLDPEQSDVVEELLDQVDGLERLCIVDEAEAYRTFLRCNISKQILEKWGVSWTGNTLGNFANALLVALQTADEPDGNGVRRVRSVIRAFERQSEELIQQMCLVNISGKVISREFIDDRTGDVLAHYSIEFEGGVTAYIPLDQNATDRLIAQQIPVFHLQEIVPHKDISISMSITQAIALDILDVSTVKNIKEFPKVYRNPNWTFWHQIRRFFAYYKWDADAPMLWDKDQLEFWVPPVLHPKVKRLLFMSSTLTEKDLHSAFPDENIEVHHIKPTAWVSGNRVFQIRSGIYPRQTILNYDDDWDVLGMSNLGQRFSLGIQSEIEKDPTVTHAILTNAPITQHLANIAEMENVCLVEDFKRLVASETTLESADVIWLVGAPYWTPGITWRQAQILYGNNAKPLCYEGDAEYGNYKDERIQSIYDRNTSGLLKHIIGRIGLSRLPNKTVVLLTGTHLPDVTDRPETLLFDWEDFEIAGGLDKLAESVVTRKQYETERTNLTVESGRDKVQQVLGCSKVHANRILNKLRGGKILRVSFRDQIIELLADGEKKTRELIAAIEGHPTSVRNELKRLTDIGDIVRLQRGVYTLPEA